MGSFDLYMQFSIGNIFFIDNFLTQLQCLVDVGANVIIAYSGIYFCLEQ